MSRVQPSVLCTLHGALRPARRIATVACAAHRTSCCTRGSAEHHTGYQDPLQGRDPLQNTPCVVLHARGSARRHTGSRDPIQGGGCRPVALRCSHLRLEQCTGCPRAGEQVAPRAAGRPLSCSCNAPCSAPRAAGPSPGASQSINYSAAAVAHQLAPAGCPACTGSHRQLAPLPVWGAAGAWCAPVRANRCYQLGRPARLRCGRAR